MAAHAESAQQSPADEVPLNYVGSTLWSQMKDVVTVGDYAYCTVGPGMMVFDISNPATPTLVSQVMTWGDPVGLTIRGTYAYVTDYITGLHIIDISDPANPYPVGNVAAGVAARDVAVSGNYAYVVNYFPPKLKIVDISNPAAPVLLPAERILGDYGLHITVSGNYLYVACGGYGTLIYSIATPSSPLFKLQLLSSSFYFDSHDVAVVGDSLYVAEYGGDVTIFDISTPPAPVEKDHCAIGYNLSGIAVSGENAYVVGQSYAAGGGSGLFNVDITGAFGHPSLVGTLPMTGPCFAVSSAGSSAFVADYWEGLKIFNVLDPSSPELSGTADIPAGVAGLDLMDSMLFVATRSFVATKSSGLHILNMSHPDNPLGVGKLDVPGVVNDVTVVGSYAYVSHKDSGLMIIDVSDPTTPVRIGSLDTPGQPQEVAIAGDYAYVADHDSGLQIVNISNPGLPTLAATVASGSTYGVAVSGSYAYLACSDRVRILDITDPSAPFETGSLLRSSRRLAVAGNYAYVARNSSAFDVIDISDPYLPSLAVSISVPNYTNGVSLHGDYAYLANSEGVSVFNISNPLAPYQAGAFHSNSAGSASDVVSDGEFTFAAAHKGLLILSTPQYVTGDANNDGVITSSDIIYLVNHVFKGGPAPVPVPAAGDANCDGVLTSADIIYLVNYVFKSGPPPVC